MIITRKKIKLILIWILLISLALFFRQIGLNWDRGHHLHPDERFLTMVGIELNWPENIGQYFDTAYSPLNPYNRGFSFFVYGTLPLFLVKKLAILLNKDNYDQFNLLGRQVVVFFDLGVVILLGIIGRKIIKKNWWLAPFLYAISVLPIQLAHFFTVDTFLNFFLTATFLFLILFYQKNQKFFLVCSGILLGMALACKITAGLFLFAIGLSMIVNSIKKKNLLSFFANGIIFTIPLFLSFRLFQPYAFINFFQPNPDFISSLKSLHNFSQPQVWYPPAMQWINTGPFFGFKNLFLWGLGPVLGLVAGGGIIWLLFNFKKQKEKLIWGLISFWILFLFIFQSFQSVKAMRYFLPIYPFLALVGGKMISDWLIKIDKNKYRWMLLAALVVLLVYPLSFLKIYCYPHSRFQASEWIYNNIPSGSVLSCEHWDDCLPLGLPDRTRHYETEMLHLWDKDDKVKWQEINSQLERVDYLILSSNRLWKVISNLPRQYPETSRFYKDLLAGKIDFEKVADFQSIPCFPPIGQSIFCWPDQNADESFTVYDHPEVIIFRKINEK